MNAVRKAAVTVSYGCERISDVLEEIKPLLRQHYEEIAHFLDIPLKPDWARYQQAEASGHLRIYTARSGHKLIGYAVYFVGPAPHYSDSIQALQDILYLHPDYRRGRIGFQLIGLADAMLRDEGVQLVQQHVKVKHPALGKILARMGYERTDELYVKRLA